MPTPKIEEITLAELVQDIALSGRSEKELAENAKQAERECVNGWDSSQPGTYFVRNGEKHLRSGFTHTKACMALGHKVGYFIKVPDNASDLRTAAITSNTGRPISAYEQGRIYAGMRDGTDQLTAHVGAELFEPMKLDEIAKGVGKTRTHIQNCIGVFEETPEIGAMILDGKISATVATKARGQVKDDSKRRKYLEAAYKQAVADGKETATEKHLDAVRADYAPLKAAKPTGIDAIKAEKTVPPEESPEEKRSSRSEPDDESDFRGAGESKELSLIGDTSSEPPNVRRKNELRERHIAAIAEWVQEQEIQNCDEADILMLADKITNQVLPF